MKISVHSTATHPELAPTVAAWLWKAFWKNGGHPLEDTLAMVMTSTKAESMPHTFVLFEDNIPVGTASLTLHDLDERPELSPWLAGVFVASEARGRGHAGHLVRAVEQKALDLHIPTLWLYTHTAENIYARLGWKTVENFQRNGKDHALMRRDLTIRKPD